MNLLLLGVMVQYKIDKTQLEAITKQNVVEQYKIIPKEVIELKKAQNKQKQVVAKKKTTKKKVTKKKVVKKAKKTTKKKTTKKKVVKKTYVSYNRSEIQNYVYNLMLQKGWSSNEWYALDQIVRHESSWNPNAVNKKSGACGLFQAYKCSKMASYGKDYRTNYKVQANWGLDYIKARYGSPSKAWSFWQSHHWY